MRQEKLDSHHVEAGQVAKVLRDGPHEGVVCKGQVRQAADAAVLVRELPSQVIVNHGEG